MTPHEAPHIVGVVFADLVIIGILWKVLWPLFCRWLWRRFYDKERQVIEEGLRYLQRLPEGTSKDHARDIIFQRQRAYERGPASWECLAWATTEEIEAELRRRR